MSLILAICHPGGGTAGVFHDGVAEAGAQIEEWTPAEAGRPERELTGYGGLIVLGGDQNVCEQDRFPYLTRELELLGGWLESGRPVLGVCLGAQLLAQAAGGSVPELPARQLGWLEVRPEPEATGDPLLGAAPAPFRALEWHSFGIDPPAGARVLARSATGVEAFRAGEAWGVQFHPEVDEGILDDWLEDLRVSGVATREEDARALRTGQAEHLTGWNRFGRDLARRFAQRCR